MNTTPFAAAPRIGMARRRVARRIVMGGLGGALAAFVAGGCTDPEPPGSLEATMQTTQNEIGMALRMQAERIGSGPPLVLIGGGLTGWASWVPHAERLADTREVVRLQLLSVQYGLEDRRLPDGYSVRLESRALAAALDDLGLTGPVDLAAWSYGALVTLDFALNHPERVRTLTLIEPPAHWLLPDRGQSMPDARALAAVAPRVQGDDVSIDDLVFFLRTVALIPPGTDPESLPQWESWVRHRRSLRAGPAPFDHTDDPARLRAFDRPILLVTGHGTSPFLRAVHDTLATTLPRARTLELDGGHAPHLVEMDPFLDALAGFHASAAGPATEVATQDEGEPRRLTATSHDGTAITYWRSGAGPALLLIHGTTADHTTTWRLVREDLEKHFTVYAMDRRGRGGSGDGPEYGLQREAEDVAAVVDAIGEPVHLLGHSYGALVGLEAARMTPGVDRLILYEGVPLRGTELYPPGMQQRFEALLEAGDPEELLVAMYRDLVGMPPGEIELIRGQRDAWARRIANAPTMPRELAEEQAYVFEPGRFAHVRAPTLLLVGEDSPAREMENARGVAAALPDARVVVLPGQQHAAMYTAPEAFAAEVVRFLVPTP
jgi:pimeloyl-ACP methyl ester carboxylesterase